MTIKKTFTALAIAVVIASLMAVAGTQFDARGGGSSGPQLEGSWEVTVTPTGGDPIINLATFTSGGGLIATDPDPNLSTGLGTWVKTGDHEFAVTFVHFLSEQGVPVGTVKVRAVGQLDKKGDTMSASFQTDVVIGGNVVQTICGTVHATRIAVEAPECP